MAREHKIFLIVLMCIYASSTYAQDDFSAPPPASYTVLTYKPISAVNASTDLTIPLTVPTGTAIQVVLDKEVRVQRAGQPVHGRVAEPVYAFDKLVVPVGTEVTGQILQLAGVSGAKRTLDALNADFSPPRKVRIEFDNLKLSDGRHIPIKTNVTTGSGEVIQFVTTAKDQKRKGLKDTASEKTDQAKDEAKRQWSNAMKQVHGPGKFHKLERYALAQLPVHPQYIDAGTVYFAELDEPLDFGTEPLTSEMVSSIGTPLSGSVVRARLMTGLSSATAKKGEEIEGVLSQPLFDGKRLVLPQGSRLNGSVVQVRPARRLNHNGRLRMVFHQIILPDGVEQKVEASLIGVQAGKEQDVKLDSEGGAETNSPKSRYLTTGVSVGLAFVAARGDPDARNGDVSGNTNSRLAGGVGGFKLVGIAIGVFAHSQPLGMAMGAYGASMSVYSHFIARGRDLVFPKDTAMEIAIGTRASAEPPIVSRPADQSGTKQ